MKKPYSLDFTIERDVDRVQAVSQILDTLEYDPSEIELEQMASYILYGKDENGLNSAQRGETISNTRYNSYRTKNDKLLSLEQVSENHDPRDFKSPHQRNIYTNPVVAIRRPKYDAQGHIKDPGDSDIPGITQIWESIDRLEHQIAVLKGQVPPAEGDPIDVTDYQLYQMRHILIALRRHQYYLRDFYKPQLHFNNIDRPQAQFIDWASDSFYWIPLSEWETRVRESYSPSISHQLSDYDVRKDTYGRTLVKWTVQLHTFNWENPSHIRALTKFYMPLYDAMHEKLDTYGCMLLYDFDRYRKMANLTEIREFLLDCRIAGKPYPAILSELKARFGIQYNESHLSTIMTREIPQAIAAAATKHRILLDTPPENCKTCFTCKRILPRNTLFFAHNRSHRDGFASSCKECEKRKKLLREGRTSDSDRRRKDPAMSKV